MNKSPTSPRILLAYDGSASSRDAFAPAANLARLLHGSIILTRVHMVPSPIWVHPDEAVRQTEIQKLQAVWSGELQQAAGELMESAALEVQPVVRSLGERWTVADEILAVAEEFDPALLVLATQGENAVRHFVVGSTAMEVLSHSSRPVVLIKSSGTEQDKKT